MTQPATHRIKTNLPGAVFVTENDRNEVALVVGTDSILIPRAAFEALFQEIPQVDGHITYSCSCPGIGPLNVPRSFVMDAYQNGIPLTKAGQMLAPNYPKVYEALCRAADQMVGEGHIPKNPFYGG